MLCGVLISVNAFAEEPYPNVWLNPGFFSYHFDRDKGLRENNIGFGAEIEFNADHAAMAGTFINSDNERSRYAAYEWRPLQWNPAGINVKAGLIVAALDGYPRVRNGDWYPALLPLLTVQGDRLGANLTVVPTIGDRLYGAIVLQLKLRIW